MLPDEKEAILSLLLSTEEHLSLAITLVGTENRCLEVLHQLQAVQATLHKCGHLLASYQLRHSLETACYDTILENRSAELNHLVDLFCYYQEFS